MSAAIDHGYLASARYILNHDIMGCTADGVVGNHLFSGRALGISEPWDLIQLHPDLKPLWPDIRAHYRRIGLSHTENVIWHLSLRQLGSHIGYQPSVFYFGPGECRYWGDRAWSDTVEFINSKNNFMALAAELGIEVPRTLCFESVADIDPEAVQEMSFPCYLKAAVSVSGVGIYRCEDAFALAAALDNFSEDVPVQLQEEVRTDRFLNLQYQVSAGELIRLAASEQILDGFSHQGNRVPASHAPWDAVDSMAHWLRDHGMQGIFAFDVAVVPTPDGVRFPVIECNPRYNGASYPTLIARKLGIPAWTALSLTTTHRSLADIDLQDIEYDRRSGEGAIIVNWGTVIAGRLVVLTAGSPEYQEALAVELEARLC
jgi:hypothetical protein